MRILFFIIPVILAIIWIVSFLVSHVAGALIHILLVIAVISIILDGVRIAGLGARVFIF